MDKFYFETLFPKPALNFFARFAKLPFSPILPNSPCACCIKGPILAIKGCILFMDSANCNCCFIRFCVSFVKRFIPSLPRILFNSS